MYVFVKKKLSKINAVNMKTIIYVNYLETVSILKDAHLDTF